MTSESHHQSFPLPFACEIRNENANFGFILTRICLKVAGAALLLANPRLKVKSDILANLPLATLEGSPGIRQAIEQEAQRIGIKLNMRLRFSSYPQLAQAVHTLGVAAIMPELAATSFEGANVRVVPLPFLGDLSRQVMLVWNRKMAEVRPAIAKYSRLLPAMFRMDGR
jgi:DNA-binding transcriptional LysR family regulator